MGPKNLLIYYGWLNSFNSASNSWNNEKVAQEMAKYNVIVLGDGLQSTGHGDWSNTNVIVPRIKELNPNVIIFGYVTTNQSYSNLKTKVNEWKDNLSIHGIFMDEFGYDYGSTSTNDRPAVNKKIDYIHSNSLLVMANAWKIEHVFGINADASYPNSTWNPDSLDINLSYDDWYLLESFAVDSAGAYESKTQWYNRGNDSLNDVFCNIAAVSCIDESDNNKQSKFDFIYTSALMFSLDSVGSSDYASSVSYGASSAKVKLYARPDISNVAFQLPTVSKVDLGDSDIYLRYLENSVLKLDFSSGSESSSIDVL